MDNKPITRCTRCLMTDRFPGITFNREGVCSFCQSYTPDILPGEEHLLEKIREKQGEAYDCVIGISGGKDSCYVAYLARKKFGLRVLAVTYDFPFVVDLARKNTETVCNSLGIELKVVKSRNDFEYSLLRNHLT